MTKEVFERKYEAARGVLGCTRESVLSFKENDDDKVLAYIFNSLDVGLTMLDELMLAAKENFKDLKHEKS